MINTSSVKTSSKTKYIFLISFIIEILITVFILSFINNFLSSMDNIETVNNNVTIPKQVSNISFSYDHKYVQYIQNGKLVIWDMDNNKLNKEIDEKNPIVYSYFLDDRNIITYFVKSDKSGNEINLSNNSHSKVNILVKTFNLGNKGISDYGSLTISDFQKIDQVVYSSLTNVIYINISVNNSSHNIIYKINVMKQKEAYESGKSIKNMVLLKNEDKLIFEDEHGNIYIDRKRLNIKDHNSLQLLGSDADNNVYLMSLAENKILKLNGQNVIGTMPLKEGKPKSVINNSSGIFLTYTNFAIDITTNPDNQITFNKGDTILNIFDHTIYTLNNKGECEKNNY